MHMQLFERGEDLVTLMTIKLMDPLLMFLQVMLAGELSVTRWTFV
jgi:hypothetical protein